MLANAMQVAVWACKATLLALASLVVIVQAAWCWAIA